MVNKSHHLPPGRYGVVHTRKKHKLVVPKAAKEQEDEPNAPDEEEDIHI